MATASTGDSPSPKKVKPPRSHWDMLMERRTVEDLEAVLAERLEVIKERRAMEARAIADVTARDDTVNGIRLLPVSGGVIMLLLWAFVPAVVGAAFSMNRDIT